MTAIGRLTGKVALVTGAASGIGLATAKLFAAEGACVGLADRYGDAACTEAQALISNGHRAFGLGADMLHSAQVDLVVSRCIETFGRVDILFANAGIGSTVTASEATDAQWDEVMNVNARGVFFACRAALQQMLGQPTGGSIVINASISGLAGIPGQGVYGPSKGALVQMTRQMAVEYAQNNIRVNCVCPGTVDTPLLRRAMAESGDADGFLHGLLKDHPIGRIGSSEEVAAAVLFLASDEASFVTGAVLAVDGGFTAK